jgi:uncharacterized membrane protein
MNNTGPYYRPPGAYPPNRPPGIRWLPILIAAIFVSIAALFLLIILFPASFGLSPPTYSPRYGLFGGFFGFFLILLVAFFIVRVAFWGTRSSSYRGRYRRGEAGDYGPNRPLRIARMRYARGEITREQYTQIEQDLNRGPGAP